MKIIISYASAGAGHFKAAEALYFYIKEHYKGIELELIDILDKSNPLFKFFYSWGYSFLIRKAPLVWWWAFWITSFRLSRDFLRLVARPLNKLNTKTFSKFLIRENSDFVISTHFLPSEIVSNLKSSGKIKSKLVTVITDFGVHPFWICRHTDLYTVASEYSKEKLLEFKVPENNIKIFGIPVHSKFLKKYDREELCGRLGIDPGKFTVLIMTGSFGTGPLEEVVVNLNKEIQLLVVCAHNKRLYSRLAQRNLANVFVFGFINNPEELMAVSHVMITKPGGLSISESLCMELLPVFIVPIPGQETENLKALFHHGIGIYPKKISEIRDVILDLKRNPGRLRERKEIIRNIKKPYACEEIYNVVCGGSAGASC